jgi:nucleoside-diphosphate-sugar epimerase
MILVTGGTGFLGAHLLCSLIDQGKRVRAIRRKSSLMNEFNLIASYRFSKHTPVEIEKILAKLEWIEADLLDIPALEAAFEGITHVYHVAAMISFVPKHVEQMMQANVHGTANIVNLCLSYGIRKLCYASSIAALGRMQNGQLMDEKTEWEDSPLNSNYALSKYRAEMEVWRGAEEGLDVVIVNPGVILGVGDWKKGSCRMLAAACKKLPMYTLGVNGYIDVKDVVRAMLQLMESAIVHERFVLVSANLSFKELFQLVNQQTGNPNPTIEAPKWLTTVAVTLDGLRAWLLGKDPLVTTETTRALHNRFFYKAEKIEQQIGFTFTPVETTIAETISVFRSVS